MPLSKHFHFTLVFLIIIIKGYSEGQVNRFTLDNMHLSLKNASFTSITLWVSATSNVGHLKPSRNKSNPNKYVVQYSKEGHAWHNYGTLLSGASSHEVTIEGLSQNTTYNVRLVGCNTCDESELESVVTNQRGIPYESYHTQADSSPGLELKIRQDGCDSSIHLQWRPINWLANQLASNELLVNERCGNERCIDESIYFIIKWSYSYVKCARSAISPSESKNISGHELSYELPAKPFANYNVSISTGGSVAYTMQFAPITTSGSCNPYPETETPEVRVIRSDETTIYLNVTLSCHKFKGPLFLNYRVVSDEDSTACSNTDYQTTATELPLANDLLAVKDLIPDCAYQIILRLSRSSGLYQEGFEFGPIEAATAMDVVSDKVRGLEATSVGPDHISFRWLPPIRSRNIKEYYICYNIVNKDFSRTCFTIGLIESECRLWEAYHCGNMTTNIVADESYRLAVFAINLHTLNSFAFADKIRDARNRGKYSEIGINTREGVPQEPWNLKAFWSSPDTLNISWNHPNCTKGTIQSFTINVLMQYYTKNITKALNHPVESPRNYKPEYFQLFSVPIETNITLFNIKICVNTVNSHYSSECVPEDLQIPPPTPQKPGEKPKFEEQYLLVPLSKKSDFESQLFVYASSFYNEPDLKRLFAEFARTSSEMPQQQIYNQTERISQQIKNRLYGTFQHDMFKLGIQNFSIAIFRINVMNGRRSVLLETEFLGKHHESPQPFGDEANSDALWAVPVLLLLVPTLIYTIYRYRHSLVLKVQNAMFHYAADDFVSLTLDGVQSEFKPEVNYERCKTQHSKRVKVVQFVSYVKDAIKNQELQRQHQMFPRAEALMAHDSAFTCTFGSLQQNRSKNRYNNVLPFDHNLVTLSQTGYINANYIDGYNTRRAYIATQGPLPTTIYDFWRMIWENHVVSVVMMANLFDDNKKNCEKYWPEFGQELDFNGIKVTLCADTSYSTYNVREMRVCLDGAIRKVSQVHFTCWPSMGHPLYPQTLVPLAQKILTLPYGSKSPILVHCGAGVGRTGTIILCDVSLRMAAAEGAVDLLGTLQRLREQRPNMVDNAEQYKLAHLVVLASLTAWNTTITCDNMENAVERILEDGLVERQVEYLIESEWQDEAMKTAVSAAIRRVPIVSEKNRVPDILPDESCQVFLNQWDDGYINAITVGGYRCPGKFIVTQQPLPTTLGDFWRLVAEQHSRFVVNLNYSGSNDEVFWPGAEASFEFHGNVRVKLLNSTSEQKLTVVKVRVCYELNGCEKTAFPVEILNFVGWPRETVTPDNLNDFVCFLMDSLSMARNASPVIVTCFDGAKASGLYVTLWNLVEQLQRDKRCDVCQTVRTIRICRKQFVCTKEQLEEIYKALLLYLRSFNEYMEVSF